MRLVLAIAAILSTSAAFAAALPPPPDPTAANLTPAQIQTRAQDACLITQAKLMNVTREDVRGPCACYAQRTVRSMSKTELANFRATGYFDDATRQKALGFIDQCKLKRPF